MDDHSPTAWPTAPYTEPGMPLLRHVELASPQQQHPHAPSPRSPGSGTRRYGGPKREEGGTVRGWEAGAVAELVPYIKWAVGRTDAGMKEALNPPV